MLSRVTRIPPPPLLELTLPSVPLLADPEPPLTLGVKGVFDTANTDVDAVTPKPHTTIMPYPIQITTNSSTALRRLVDLVHQINAEMEDSLSRIRLAIGQTEKDIKQLRAERTQRTTGEVAERGASDSNPKIVSKHDGDARNDVQIC